MKQEEECALKRARVSASVIKSDVLDVNGSDLEIRRSFSSTPLESRLEVLMQDGGGRVIIMEDLQSGDRRSLTLRSCLQDITMLALMWVWPVQHFNVTMKS